MTEQEVEDRIESWHLGGGFGIPLHEFLGWNREQMQAYVLNCEIPDDDS